MYLGQLEPIQRLSYFLLMRISRTLNGNKMLLWQKIHLLNTIILQHIIWSAEEYVSGTLFELNSKAIYTSQWNIEKAPTSTTTNSESNLIMGELRTYL